MTAAQPLIREGFRTSKNKNEWSKESIYSAHEIQVGYYRIIAKDMDEAISIAKENPEFEFVSTAGIEVRPIKMKKEKTSFVYP